MRFVIFLLLGAVLGYLYFGWMHRSGRALPAMVGRGRTSLVLSMAVRLGVFALALGLLLHRFGPAAGAAALLGMVAVRFLIGRAPVTRS